VTTLSSQCQVIVGSYVVPLYEGENGTQSPGRTVPRRSQMRPHFEKEPLQDPSTLGRGLNIPAVADWALLQDCDNKIEKILGSPGTQA